MGAIFEARTLFLGDLLVKVCGKYRITGLPNFETIQDLKVTVFAHRTRNTVRGMISENHVMNCPQYESVEGLQFQGVVAAKCIIIRIEAKEQPTEHVVLRFDRVICYLLLNPVTSTARCGPLYRIHFAAFVASCRAWFAHLLRSGEMGKV